MAKSLGKRDWRLGQSGQTAIVRELRSAQLRAAFLLGPTGTGPENKAAPACGPELLRVHDPEPDGEPRRPADPEIEDYDRFAILGKLSVWIIHRQTRPGEATSHLSPLLDPVCMRAASS